MPHPSAEELAAFVSGRISEAAAQSLERHLENCGQCRLVLEALPEDSLTAALLHAKPLSAAPSKAPQQGSGWASFWDDAARDMMPPDLGDHPRYRVLEVLGHGGMGVVFKAEHRILGRQVALKVIRPRLLHNPETVERFLNEIKAAARLAHPNIVTAFDADRAGDIHFLAMEFVPGRSLADLLAAGAPLPVAAACAAARQVVLGLQHAWGLGMVHRDIKPQNLMRTESGQVKILDFGLAFFGQESSGMDVPAGMRLLLGSPDYVAPEQIRDPQTADFRADLYSLGCTLYHLLSGAVPFPDRTIAEKVTAHLQEAPLELARVCSELPPALSQLVSRLMAKEPAERFQDHAEVLDALEPFLPPDSGTLQKPASRLLLGHTAHVVCVAFSPFGFLLASGSTDETVRLWALTGQQEVDTLFGQKGAVRAVAFSPDGRILATVGDDACVRLWDVPHRKEIRRLRGHAAALRAVAFDPVGQLLAAAGDDGPIKLWDLAGNEVAALPGHSTGTLSLAFAPGGRWLASGGRDRKMLLWDLRRGKVKRTLAGRPGPVSGLAFHPDGGTLGIACHALQLRGLRPGCVSRSFSAAGGKIRCLSFNPDGSALAWGAGNHLVVWKPGLALEPCYLDGHSGPVNALAFHPNGKLLASASADQSIRIWSWN